MIDFKIERIHFKDEYTIGKLYYRFNSGGWLYLCDTLEDKLRENEVKVWGKTCIDAGVYDFIMAYSPHFKRILPCLLNVPKFVGIMMHNGTTAEDSHGCILVGKNKEKGKVLESRLTLDRLINLLEHNVQDKYRIEIINMK